MRSRVHRLTIFTALQCLTACGTLPAGTGLSAAPLAACSTSLTVNLTVELAPELASIGQNLRIELRQGIIGHSKVVNTQDFRGTTGTVFFANLCDGSYFMDIGNGPLVAVTPVHQFGDNGRYQSTIRVSFAKGNVATRKRNEL